LVSMRYRSVVTCTPHALSIDDDYEKSLLENDQTNHGDAKRDMPERNVKKTYGAANKADVLLLLSACRDQDEARRISRTLIDEHLASCVNIAKVDSIYRWKGQVEESEEHMIIAKTKSSVYEKAEETIRALHSYELPEIIALKVKKGHAAYLDWIAGNVGTPESG